MKKSLYKIIFKILLISVILYFSVALINSYFGWYGYERWKYRKGTYGDKTESLRRGVYIKDLKYISNVDLSYFKVYIEKGYWCSYSSLEETRFKENIKYPFQVSLKTSDSIKNVVYKIVNYNKFDSINNNILDICVYLSKPSLKDTIILKIIKFDKSQDSIGYIKVWDNNKK
jgi:hypothetical protein